MTGMLGELHKKSEKKVKREEREWKKGETFFSGRKKNVT
jgi:hypothetical protein